MVFLYPLIFFLEDLKGINVIKLIDFNQCFWRYDIIDIFFSTMKLRSYFRSRLTGVVPMTNLQVTILPIVFIQLSQAIKHMTYLRSSRQTDGSSSSTHDSFLWTSIHILQIQPKVWMFLQRAIQNIILTGIDLWRKSIVGDTVCIHYDFHFENDRHILFKTNGEESQLLVLGIFFIMLSYIISIKILQFFLHIVGTYSSGQFIVSQTLYFVEEFSSFMKMPSSLHNQATTRLSRQFLKPLPQGISKVNTNVAFSDGKIGTGIIIRNYLGIPLFTGVISRLGLFFFFFFCGLQRTYWCYQRICDGILNLQPTAR